MDRRHAAANLLGPDHKNVVHHLHASREGDGDTPDPGGRWLTAFEGTQASDDIQPEYAQLLQRQAAFNADVRKYAAQIASQSQDPPPATHYPVWAACTAADWLTVLASGAWPA